MTAEEHLAILLDHLAHSGLGELVTPASLRPLGVLEVQPAQPDRLWQSLRMRGWLHDPLPWLRARTKPWVAWSLRQDSVGLGIHLEAEVNGVYAIHLDTYNPSHWWRWPAHLFFDHYGWSTRRIERLRLRGALTP
ncbi:MAG: hypothetical protein ACI9WU_003716 [Myxococcota bacterium]|jgi:hypothetical protein